MTTIKANIISVDGSPLTGSIQVSLEKPLIDPTGRLIVAPSVFVVPLVTGQAEFSLSANGYYLFSVMATGVTKPVTVFRARIPESSTPIDLMSLASLPIGSENESNLNVLISRLKEDIVPVKGDKGDKGDPGIQGIQGLTGLQGIKGDKGDKGDTGLTGAKGDKGDPGLPGAQGIQGIKGDTGLKGDKGDPGIQGIQGIKGDKGDTGLTGAKGDQGIQGIPGATGAKGDTGATGVQGIQGIQGLKGDKGDPGAGADQANVVITGGTINGTAIGATTPSNATFTDVLAKNNILIDTVGSSPENAKLIGFNNIQYGEGARFEFGSASNSLACSYGAALTFRSYWQIDLQGCHKGTYDPPQTMSLPERTSTMAHAANGKTAMAFRGWSSDGSVPLLEFIDRNYNSLSFVDGYGRWDATKLVGIVPSANLPPKSTPVRAGTTTYTNGTAIAANTWVTIATNSLTTVAGNTGILVTGSVLFTQATQNMTIQARVIGGANTSLAAAAWSQTNDLTSLNISQVLGTTQAAGAVTYSLQVFCPVATSLTLTGAVLRMVAYY